MSQLFLLLGILFVIIGVMIIAFFALGIPGETKTEVAVGGFIGPIPFGFATSRNMLYLTIALSAAMFAAFIILSR
jgi:uncharacterized membrane protein